MTQWYIVKSGAAVLVCKPGAQVRDPRGKTKPLQDDPDLCWITDQGGIVWVENVDWAIAVADLEEMVGDR